MSATDRGVRRQIAARSAPPYPFTHAGTVLVCADGFTFDDDYARARQLFPDAPAIAVNNAAGKLRAFALFTLHARKFPKWIAAQRASFGEGFATHSSGTVVEKTKFGKQIALKPFVDYWWQNAAGNGTSTWGARKLARYMGFDRVVLVGMPLEVGGYAGGRMAKAFQQHSVVEDYRRYILRDTAFHDGVVSMSGWTRELFGGP